MAFIREGLPVDNGYGMSLCSVPFLACLTLLLFCLLLTAVGLLKLQALINTQAQMCEVMLTKRLEKLDFQIDQIKDAEFVGIYEMVIEELLPLG